MVKYTLMIASGVLLGFILIWPHMMQQKNFVNKMLAEATRNVPDKASINMQQVFFKAEDEKHQPYTITADSIIETDVNNNVMTLDNPTSTMKLNSGMTLFAQAPAASLWQSKKILQMINPVTIRSDDGHRATIKELTIDAKERSAFSPNPFTLTGPRLFVSADRFSLQDNGDNIFLYGKVKIRFQDTKKDKKFILMAEEKVHIEQPTNTITALQNARLNDGTNILAADKLIIHMTKMGKQQYELEELEAYGHVVVKTPDEIIKGDEAFYTQDTATVTGNAEIQRKGGRLTGSKISIDMKSGLSKIISDSMQRVKGRLSPTMFKGN